jgi:hypothetical protein
MNKTEWIQRQCCFVCGGGEWLPDKGEWRTHAAHARRASNSGIGQKPSDKWLVPLCATHHAEQHQKGEQFDMFEVAKMYEKRYNSMRKNK